LKADYSRTGHTCSCDLDLSSTTLRYPDLEIPKIQLPTKMNFVHQGFQKLRALDRHVTDNTTMLHWQVQDRYSKV